MQEIVSVRAVVGIGVRMLPLHESPLLGILPIDEAPSVEEDAALCLVVPSCHFGHIVIVVVFERLRQRMSTETIDAHLAGVRESPFAQVAVRFLEDAVVLRVQCHLDPFPFRQCRVLGPGVSALCREESGASNPHEGGHPQTGKKTLYSSHYLFSIVTF